jgi:hypothetical protein
MTEHSLHTFHWANFQGTMDRRRNTIIQTQEPHEIDPHGTGAAMRPITM